MCVATDLPERGGMDEVDMALHHFGEGVLGIRSGENRQQFGIGRHRFSSYSTRETGKRTRKMQFAGGEVLLNRIAPEIYFLKLRQ